MHLLQDVSFWTNEDFTENNLCEVVRSIAGAPLLLCGHMAVGAADDTRSCTGHEKRMRRLGNAQLCGFWSHDLLHVLKAQNFRPATVQVTWWRK